MKNLSEYKSIDQYANAVARQHGSGFATTITVAADPDFPVLAKIGRRVAFGYRKKSNDQYVPNAYRARFGWKNTYYQSAKCEVIVNPYVAFFFQHK